MKIEAQQVRTEAHYREPPRLQHHQYASARRNANMAVSKTSLLTAVDSTLHIHLIIGSNPLASSRVTKSLEVGAKPLIIAPEGSNVHFGLEKRIEDGEVKWVKKEFEEKDLWTFGREELGGWVDAVFVAGGGKSVQSEFSKVRTLKNGANADD